MFNTLFSEKSLEKWIVFFWGLVLFSLPVTSFRHFPAIFGTTLRQPLAFIPLAAFLLLLAIRLLKTRRLDLPPQLGYLLLFVLAALIASVVGILQNPSAVRGYDLFGRSARAWVSFSIGIGFFVSAIFAARSETALKGMLKWLYAGLVLSFVWGMVQVFSYIIPVIDQQWVEAIRETYTFPALIYRRIYGFAYEPSWFADQITILYLPWLLASVLSAYHLGMKKWLPWLLIAMSAVLLLFTFSRHGILGAIVAMPVVLVVSGRNQIKSAWQWFWQAFRSKQRNLKALSLRLVLVLLVLAMLVGAAYFLNRSDYFSNLWTASLEEGFVEYVIKNNAGPRLAYLIGGMGVYTEAPITGVGLGGAGIYLFDHFPDWSLSGQPEMDRFLSPDSSLIPNIKNLYVRLLAETGLFGFWLFVAFLLSILGSIWKLLRQKDVFARFIGTAGLFIWVTVVLRNFTQDSLTFPVMWVSLGLVVGFAHRYNARLLKPEGAILEQ